MNTTMIVSHNAASASPDASLEKIPASKKSLLAHFNSKLDFDPLRDLRQLREASPVDVEHLPQGGQYFFDILFPDKEQLVCRGASFMSMRTGYGHELPRGPESYNFAVPTPG